MKRITSKAAFNNLTLALAVKVLSTAAATARVLLEDLGGINERTELALLDLRINADVVVHELGNSEIVSSKV